MKKHTILPEILIFFVILLGCIVPPFFATTENTNKNMFTLWTFPYQALGRGFFALAVYIITKKVLQQNQIKQNCSKKLYFLLYVLVPIPIVFGAIFSISLFHQFIASLLKITPAFTVQKPQNAQEITFCLLNFLNAAFYEEVIYRFYFPETLSRLLCIKKQSKILVIIAEITGTLVFAFAHLYLGPLSVINALAAHVILRLCYKKSGNIWAGFAAHFIYNIVSLILL